METGSPVAATLRSVSPSSARVLCVSHGTDVDGCVCAALVKCGLHAQFLLVDYGRITECLQGIPDRYDIVYLCDLGLTAAQVAALDRVRAFAAVRYVDHHPLADDLLAQLEGLGVEVVHDRRDCASALVFHALRAALPRDAGLLAAYAAVSDRLEEGPLARALLARYDRDLVYFEAMTLAYALDRADGRLKRRWVTQLAALAYPHQIEAVPRLAVEQAERIAGLRQTLAARAVTRGRVAYVDAGKDALGTVANLLLDVCEAAVGVSYHLDEKRRLADLSLRGRHGIAVDLGQLTAQLASAMGGFGGGHPLASGARLPAARLPDFLHALVHHVAETLQAPG